MTENFETRRASLLDASEFLWLIIDVQERLFPAMPEDVQANLLKTLHVGAVWAKEFLVPTIITEQYPKGLGHTINSLSEALDEPTLAVQTVEKTSFSALGEPNFQDALEQTRRKKILLVGMEAHICVLQTALDLLQTKHEVTVAIDGIASRKKLHWTFACQALKDAGAQLTNMESFAFQCLGAAGGPRFKALSRAIR